MRIRFLGEIKEMTEEDEGLLIAFDDRESDYSAKQFGLFRGDEYTFILVEYKWFKNHDVPLSYGKIYDVEAEGGIVNKPPTPKRGRRAKAAICEKANTHTKLLF